MLGYSRHRYISARKKPDPRGNAPYFCVLYINMESESSMMEPIGSFTPANSGDSGWSIWWILGCIICIVVVVLVAICLTPAQQTTDTPADLHDDLQHERLAQPSPKGTPTNELPEPEPHDGTKGGNWCFIGEDGDKRVCGQGSSCQSGSAFLTQEACLRAD